MESTKKTLNFYGVTISICGYEEIVTKLFCDFAFFSSTENATEDIKLNINLENPPYDKISGLIATMYKTDCIIYDDKDLRYVDYNKKCLCIYNKKDLSAELYSKDYDLLYEISFLFIHSRIGELLDLKGFHRIHSCAFSYNGFSYILMLPQGAGKSTFLFDLIKSDEIKIISDDTPVINSKGKIFPFPIRIGLCNDIDTTNIKKEYIYNFKRRKFGDKKLLSYEYFKDKIENEHLPIKILYGQRIFSDCPKIKKTNKLIIFKELIKNCIIGYGLPQVLEYFLSCSIKDIFIKIYIVLLRTYSCIILLLKSKETYCFYLSNNTKENTKNFLTFFKGTNKNENN